MQRVTRDPRDGKALGFAFKPPERSGRVVFEVEDGELKIGDRTLLDDFELWLERGEHVSLIGPNGAGKTTLIKALAGERELDAGKLRRGHNVKLGLLSQHADEPGAPGARTVLEATQRATGLKPNEARSLLGQFLFSGETAEKPLDGLSGGERRRLSLAILVHSGANVLILDEPTNHLDLESREALESALQVFPGSLLLISHDRALLDAVGSRTVAVEDRTLHSYVGGWPEYLRVREERAEAERTAKRAKPAPPPKPKAKPGPSKNQQRRAGELEKAIESAEAELRPVEAPDHSHLPGAGAGAGRGALHEGHPARRLGAGRGRAAWRRGRGGLAHLAGGVHGRCRGRHALGRRPVHGAARHRPRCRELRLQRRLLRDHDRRSARGLRAVAAGRAGARRPCARGLDVATAGDRRRPCGRRHAVLRIRTARPPGGTGARGGRRRARSSWPTGAPRWPGSTTPAPAGAGRAAGCTWRSSRRRRRPSPSRRT
jgi:ATPase subunit of ABC transporter with duplicated ATPase domains